MRLVILAVGTRGDVQPYVALGIGLRQAGYDVRLAADPEFEDFAERYRLEFFPLALSAREELRTQRTNAFMTRLGHNPVTAVARLALRRTNPAARSSQGRFLDSCWKAGQGADAVISSPLAYPGESIAERLGVPWILAWYAPWNSPAFLRAYFPRLPISDVVGRLLWAGLQHGLWQAIRQDLNRWRRETLGLRPIPLFGPFRARYQRRVPVLYGFSPCLLPRPRHWPPWYHITGQWFLDRPTDWQPPARVVEFLESGPPPVSIGFGSMPITDPARLTETVVDALRQTGQRGVILSGWGGLGQGDLPDDVLLTDDVPHDWLFPRVAAAIHHGGAGTVAASLRAGVPTIVVPFIGEQTFWGVRVAELGVGPPLIRPSQLSSARLAAAIRSATGDAGIRARAAEIGHQMRLEDGVARAVELVKQYVGPRS
jgi:sterol 3beta-glucosyltransferase